MENGKWKTENGCRGEFIRPNFNKKEVRIMKKFLTLAICYLLLATCSVVYADQGSPGAYGAYGSVTKTIAITSGTATPANDRGAWSGAGRADLTNDAFLDMTPAGDGTYFYKASLVPDAYYNFQFTGYTGATAPTGLTANTTYFDPVPAGGEADAGFIVARSSTDVAGTAMKGRTFYGSTKDGARRYVRPPQDVDTSGTRGAWVYCNWGSTPNVNMEANPTGSTSIRVKFNAGWWGLGEAYKSLDVSASSDTTAAYWIYFASGTGSAAPDTYRLLFSTPGWSDYCDHTGLVTGGTYYYIATASDAYKGSLNPAWPSVGACYLTQFGTMSVTAPTGYALNQISSATWARPSAAIPVYFKVEAPNWDYITSHDNVVYLTPYNCYNEPLPYRIPGKITRVYLPKT